MKHDRYDNTASALHVCAMLIVFLRVDARPSLSRWWDIRAIRALVLSKRCGWCDPRRAVLIMTSPKTLAHFSYTNARTIAWCMHTRTRGEYTKTQRDWEMCACVFKQALRCVCLHEIKYRGEWVDGKSESRYTKHVGLYPLYHIRVKLINSSFSKSCWSRQESFKDLAECLSILIRKFIVLLFQILISYAGKGAKKLVMHSNRSKDGRGTTVIPSFVEDGSQWGRDWV